MTTRQLENEVKQTLYTLDERKIRAFAELWGMQLPKPRRLFWAAIYWAVLRIEDSPKGVRQQAHAWLTKNGLEVEDETD